MILIWFSWHSDHIQDSMAFADSMGTVSIQKCCLTSVGIHPTALSLYCNSTNLERQSLHSNGACLTHTRSAPILCSRSATAEDSLETLPHYPTLWQSYMREITWHQAGFLLEWFHIRNAKKLSTRHPIDFDVDHWHLETSKWNCQRF